MAKFIIILLNLVYIITIAAIGACISFIFVPTLIGYFTMFVAFIALQLGVGRLWSSYVDKRMDIRIREVETAQAMADAIQYAELECEYCHTRNVVRIRIGKENKFTCDTCKEITAVHIKMTCTRITQPIMPKADLASIFSNLDS